MANKLISQLTAASSVTGTDLIEIEQSGASKKATLALVLAYVEASHTHSISSGAITGLGTGIATALAATPTGTGSVVLSASPTLDAPVLQNTTQDAATVPDTPRISFLTYRGATAYNSYFFRGRLFMPQISGAPSITFGQSMGPESSGFFGDGIGSYIGNGCVALYANNLPRFWCYQANTFVGGKLSLAPTNLSAPSGLVLHSPTANKLQIGDSSAAPAVQTVQGPAGSGTNITGGTLNISAGPGTGSAASGDITFSTHATGGSSGTAVGTPVVRAAVLSGGQFYAGGANTVTGTAATALGTGNYVTSDYSAAIGKDNSVFSSNTNYNFAIGWNNYLGPAPGVASIGNVLVGCSNVLQTITSTGAFISGYQAVGRHTSERLHATSAWAYLTPIQFGECALYIATTNATPTELFLDGATGARRFTLVAGQTYDCSVRITGRKSDGTQSASYWRRALIQRTGTATTLVGSVQTLGTDIEDDAAWDVSITADDTNDALKITVTGAAATDIRWVARIDFTEVNY